MSPVPVLAMVAQVDNLGARAGGLLAQILAILLGLTVTWVGIVVVWRLLQEMLKNPDYGKLLTIVGIGLFAAFLVGAAPDALDAAYAYGAGFLSGGG